VGLSAQSRAGARRLGFAAFAAGLCLAASAALAQDATWNGATTDWNTATNWTPNTVPGGTAIFSSTGSTTVDNASGNVTIGAISFTAAPPAQAYTINIDNTFTINGAGVTNSSANTQVFNVDPLSNAVPLIFQNSATANNGTGAVIYNNEFFIFFQNASNAGNANTTVVNNEIVQFNDTSSAGSATFTNNIQIDFFDSTSAANANITNAATGTITFNNSATAGSATIGNPNGGTIDFTNTSTAGSAAITNAGLVAFSNTASAGNAGFINNSGGSIKFANTSTGGAATFTNNTGAAIAFNDTSTAGTTATYTSSGTAAVSFNNSATAGSASFTQNGTSTLTFNDTSTAGSSTIANNTGTVAFDNSSLGGTAHITSAATLQFNNAADAQSAAINLTGGTASFNNSATADTATITVGAATLNFNNSATAGSAAITTNSGGTTAFTGTSSGGSAAFTVATGGAFDISQLTSGGTTAGSIAGGGSFFLGGKTLTVGSLNTSTTVSGQILDGGLGAGIGGALTKVGTGTLTLTNAANLYSGATTIDGGTLTVNGAIPLSSGVAINTGGTLNGTGSVPAVTVNAGGILMPGPPGGVGTLTGTGAVTFNSGATYQIFVSSAANSKFTTTGAASLNGGASVAISNGSNIVVGDKYTILTAAGGVTGQFNPTVSFGMFKGTLSYDADDAFITFGFSTLSPLLPANAPQNAANVAAAIDKFTASGGTLPAGFGALFNLPPAQLINGLEQLDGETSTGAQIAGFQLMNQFMSLLLDPFTEGHNNGIGPVPFAPVAEPHTLTPDVANAYASVLKAPPMAVDNPWHAWGAAYGGSQSINGAASTIGSHDITTQAGGFAAGLDYRASPDTVYGVALAGGATGWSLAQGFGSGQSDAFQAGVYGTHQMGNAYVSGALAAANYWASTKRIVTVSGVDTLTASFDAQSFGARFEGGYRVNLAPVTLTPYAAVQAQSFHTPNFAETAASGSPQFALNFAAQTSTAERAEAGSWISQNFLMGNGDSVTLFGRAAYAHDWFTSLAFTPTFQALPGASFVVNGVTPPSDLALVTAGAEWHMARNWSLMARFDGEFGTGDQTYTGTARLRFTW